MLNAYVFVAINRYIFQGTYNSSEMDLKKIENYNFPKVYFYRRYKVKFKIKNVNNNVVGCGVLEVSLIRPWERPI